MNTNRIISKKNKLEIGIIFFIFPFFTLFGYFNKLYNTKFYSNLIWFFFGFLAILVNFSDESGDSFRYAEWFSEFSKLDNKDKLNYFEQDLSLDYFRFISFYIVSFFTTNPRIYFVFIALIYGYFYKNILWSMFLKLKNKPSWEHKLGLLSFVFILPIMAFTFVRFPTAMIIFLYFAIKYFDTYKFKYILFSALSIVVHFSFLLPFCILILYYLIPKTRFFFIIYVLSLFFTFFEYEFLKIIIETYLPSNIYEAKSGYLNEGYKESVEQSLQNVNWYIRYRGDILKVSSVLLLLNIYFKNGFKNIINSDLLNFSFFFGIVANIISVVPSGFRFVGIPIAIIWYVIIINFINGNFKFEKSQYNYSKILVPVFLFILIVGLRYFADSMPIDTFFSNYIFSSIWSSEIPIINFIKSE